jgi:hypothetical protein
VTSSAPAAVPPGWYPDPAGRRQWRVWTGAEWSEVTRPFPSPVATTSLVADVSLIQALRRVLVVGIVGVLGGLSLLVGVLAHWPATAHPVPWWFALAASNVAVALLVVGSVVCAFGVRELNGRWSVEAFIPGFNLFVASFLATRRLGRTRLWRVVFEVGLLTLFTVAAHDDLWLCVGPIVVAYVETSWFSALIDLLSGPTVEARGSS